MGLLDGILPAIYSGSNTLKRRLNGLLSDPMGTLATGVNRFVEGSNDTLNLAANAYPMAGDKTVLNSPAQIDSFQNQLADKGTEAAMAAATVWHGSPHKFDKFDSSKIGTGEGAQAYGHGLYLADNKSVAQGYRDKLSGNGYFSDDGKYFMKNDGKGTFHSYDPKTKNDALIDESAFYKDAPASLYKVDIPDEQIAKMLDWDKPLSQQHPDVRQFLSSHPDVLAEISKSEAQRVAMNASHPMRLQKIPSAGIPYDESRMSGNTAMSAINSRSKNAEAQMQKAGIPGVRYLDGGSRGTGQGSSNYVIFPGNEGLLSILERNGKPMGLLGQ